MKLICALTPVTNFLQTLMMANGATLKIANDANIGIPLAFRDEMGRVAWPIPVGNNISSAVGTSQVYIVSRCDLNLHSEGYST